jgi:uncharacterized NAD(P)/FAD-binding protein YdhS
MRHKLVIIGAGFCGTVLAAKLLRRPPSVPTDVILVERGTDTGRGVAYAERPFPYLLNVPAARLSADAGDPLQFLRFARRRLPHTDGEDFLPRALYGDYLQEVLLLAERSAPAHVRLVRVFDEVRAVTRRAGAQPLAAEFADRPALLADRIILALGNPPSALPPWAAAIRHHPAYRHDPWAARQALSAQQCVLIVGNGLTMADVVASLSRDAARSPMIMTISRRGLLPQQQTVFRASAAHAAHETLLESAHSIRLLLASVRRLAREAEDAGGDWREVVTLVRHWAPTLWRRLPEAERRRFVRHLQSHWDVHRHRMPPTLAEHIAALRAGGRLQVHAGRILAVMPAEGDRLQVSWRARGAGPTRRLSVDLMINATGADFALERSVDPLMRSLRTSGLVSPDALNLGLRTGDHGACVDAQGASSDTLFYLGPMLRADHWEATAATELRDHAERLAAHLAGTAAHEPAH